MPHVEKYTQAKINLILAHDLRAKNTEFRSADSSLEYKNIYYVNNGEELIQVRDEPKKMLSAARKYQEQLLQNTPHAKRKDLVTLGEWIVNCPKDIPQNDQIKFLKSSIEFVSERYGSRNIVSAAVHLDEPNAMPHLHITVVPVDKKGRICARNVFTRQELQHFHPDLERHASRALGYPVHILKDEDERSKVSLPLSQYKIKTKSEELDKKEKALEKQSEEVAEKLETAENTVSNARISAMSAASARLENYEKTSALKRFFSDPRPFVRDMVVELETAAELDRKAMDQREKELEIRELELEAEADDLRKEKDFREQEEYELEQRMKEAERMYKQCEAKVQAARKYEKSVETRENELIKKENALVEREKSINDRESMLKANVDEYWNDRANEYQSTVDDTQKKYNEAKRMYKDYWEWQREKRKWTSVERANRLAEQANRSAKTYKKLYESMKLDYNELNDKYWEAKKSGNEFRSMYNDLLKKSAEARRKCSELSMIEVKYNDMTDKYNKLQSAHEAVIDYAKMITLENSFLTDIVTDYKNRDALSVRQDCIVQVCEQNEKAYLKKEPEHSEVIANIIDIAEKQKVIYETKIDHSVNEIIQEARERARQQQNQQIYSESRSRGRSR